MKCISRSSAMQHSNGPDCTVFEYGGSDQIDGAVAAINGRYPSEDYVLNQRSEEIVYVISGQGVIVTKTERVALLVGDVAMIPANEAYFFEGEDLRLFIACAPAFRPDEHLETT